MTTTSKQFIATVSRHLRYFPLQFIDIIIVCVGSPQNGTCVMDCREYVWFGLILNLNPVPETQYDLIIQRSFYIIRSVWLSLRPWSVEEFRSSCNSIAGMVFCAETQTEVYAVINENWSLTKNIPWLLKIKSFHTNDSLSRNSGVIFAIRTVLYSRVRVRLSHRRDWNNVPVSDTI